MNSVFNTTFEISLRILLTLEVAQEKWRSVDMIAALDFITVYGLDFGIADHNLHGDNNYKFSEFTLRRELVRQGIRVLVLDGFADVRTTDQGFAFSLSSHGRTYCEKLDSDYSHAYCELAVRASEYTSSKTERSVLDIINKRSIHALQRGERHG